MARKMNYLIAVGAGVLILFVGLIMNVPMISILGFVVGILSILLNQVSGEKSEDRDRKIIEEVQKIDEKIEKSEKYKREISRVRAALREIGLSTKEIVEDFNNPLNALLIFKWGESGDVLKNRIPQLGFKSVGSGVHILPPIKTPKLKDKYDIEQWVKKNLLKDLGNSYEYVVVFAQLIDLRHLYCERKKPAYARGRTLLDLLKPEEIFTPKYLSKYLQTKKNISFEELIKQYGFIFLISKECSEDEIEELRANKDDIISQLKRAYNLKQITINDYAKMDAGTIANVLGKYPVKKPSEVASSMVKEAIFWDRFFKES